MRHQGARTVGLVDKGEPRVGEVLSEHGHVGVHAPRRRRLGWALDLRWAPGRLRIQHDRRGRLVCRPCGGGSSTRRGRREVAAGEAARRWARLAENQRRAAPQDATQQECLTRGRQGREAVQEVACQPLAWQCGIETRGVSPLSSPMLQGTPFLQGRGGQDPQCPGAFISFSQATPWPLLQWRAEP